MMGTKERHFKQHGTISLETLVPEDHFYRQLQTKLDLSFVRTLVEPTYCPDNGRPSVDPLVFFKLQLIMFFEDFRSERQLLHHVRMNLALRWYIGYDLDEAIPSTSTLSRLRERYGVKVFIQFFEKIVHLCWQAGLIWGKEQHIDTSFVKANADYDRQIPRFYWEEVNQHLQSRFQQDETILEQLITKYSQAQEQNSYSNYKRRRDYWVCPTDPDATPADRGQMAYRLHYVVDGGKARIITACLVTPNATQDPAPMQDLIWYLRFRFSFGICRVVADTRYGTQDNLIALYHQGIFPYMPFHSSEAKRRQVNACFPLEKFIYDAQNDVYTCPQGETLYYSHIIPNTQRRIYKAKSNVCGACPLREQCTTSKQGRTVSHPVVKPLLDQIVTQRQPALFRKLIRKRQVWIEPKFGELKQWHSGRHFRLRTILKVNVEALIRAAGQNIKQLLRTVPQQNPCPISPVAAVILLFDLLQHAVTL